MRCGRATSQTESRCDSPGRPSMRGLPPRVPGRPAFWLSASAGAQPPLLAAAAADDERAPQPIPARWQPHAAPAVAAAARPSRLSVAASAPAPGRTAFAVSLLASSPAGRDGSSGSLVRSLSDTAPSSTPCSPAPPPLCSKRSHQQEHCAVHRWLESLPGRAAGAGSRVASPASCHPFPFPIISPLLDRQRRRSIGCASEPCVAVEINVGTEDGACHVVCAGCSPLGRHAAQPGLLRPRWGHLLRTRTCPEPLPFAELPGQVRIAFKRLSKELPLPGVIGVPICCVLHNNVMLLRV